MQHFPRLFFTIVFPCLWQASRLAAQQFTTLDDPDGAGGTVLYGISGGTIVGAYIDGSGNEHGLVYDGSGIVTLDHPQGAGGTAAYGAAGASVVGAFYDPSGFAHGFVYSGSSYTTLDDPLVTDRPDGTFALGISGNNVVGNYFVYDHVGIVEVPHSHGFIYDGSTYTTLDAPLGVKGASANGISGGRIVGD